MRQTLAVKLPALVVAGVLLSAATGTTLALLTGRELLRQQAVDGTSRMLDGYLEGVQRYLELAQQTLALSSAPLSSATVEPRPMAAQRAVADRVLGMSPVFEYLMLLDVDGRPLFLRPSALESRKGGLSLARRDWFREAAAGQLPVGDLEVSLATGRPTVVVAQSLRDSAGDFVGVWAGGLKLAALSELGVTPGGKRAREAHGYVTDRHALVVAHQGNPAYVHSQTDFSSVPSVRSGLAGRAGAEFQWNPIERRGKVAAWSPLPDVGWVVVFASPSELALAPLATMTSRLLWAGTAVGLVFAAVSWLLVTRALRPLRHLREAAVLLGTGDLGARLLSKKRDEVGLLGEEFNRMAVSLSAKDESLREHAARLEQNVERLRAAVVQRDSTVAELDAFCYSVSHDLRAPLRAIAGFSAAVMASESAQLSDRGRSDLGRVRRATERMGQLIDDLLRLSRLSRVPLKREEIDLTVLAREICSDLAGGQPERVVTVEIAEGLRADGDPGLVRVVLEQLLGNAWKFTAHTAAAHVEVGRVGEDRDRTFFVRDNGAGFDDRYVDKLFGAFQRLHTESEFEGTGIGLATVRRVVLRHGGTVTAAGRPGAGATFTFTLPQGDPG